MANRTKTIAVIGLDFFGAAAARELTAIGDRVIGVDRDEARVALLSGELHSVVQADGANGGAMREIGLDTIDAALIAIGDDLEASVLAALNLLEFKRPEIWAKAEGEGSSSSC